MVVEKGNMKKRRRHRIKLSKINRTIENGKYEIKRLSVLRTKLTGGNEMVESATD